MWDSNFKIMKYELYNEQTLLWLCLLTLIGIGSRAMKRCKVPKSPKFDLFNKRAKKTFPIQKVEEALAANDVIKAALMSIPATDPDDNLAYYSSDDWLHLCSKKYSNVYKYGVTNGQDQCWVIQKLWIAKCTEKKCSHLEKTMADSVYYRCHACSPTVSFCAYCKSGGSGELRLLTRRIPIDCECRQFFCPMEIGDSNSSRTTSTEGVSSDSVSGSVSSLSVERKKNPYKFPY